MIITRNLNVNADRFFIHLAKSIVYDINQATGKNYVISDLHENLEYDKHMSNQTGTSGKVKLRITKWQRPVVYQAQIQSSQGTNIFSYEIETIDENHCLVTYMEDFESNAKLKLWNYKLMAMIFAGRSKKRMNLLLSAIEKHLMEEGE